ncbi:MAG: spore maturation protein [Firmicutes bacterium]|nr:spore maturation protein [Bacillota bacterium]
MNLLSKIVIPVFVLGVVFYGFRKKINVYDSFLEGAKEGLIITFNIFPTVMAMVFAINIFLDSNFINYLLSSVKPFFAILNIPLEIMPMALLRPVSGTASLAIMNDIFINYGPDSYLGRLSSIIQGCTDTTIYVLALYFGSIGIKKIRYSLKVGLFADLIGITVAFILTSILF